MIVDSCESLKATQFQMAMNKSTIKQNGHSSMNENRTDDDYGGGGSEQNTQISMYVYFSQSYNEREMCLDFSENTEVVRIASLVQIHIIFARICALT